jgi:hypothetical protein
MAHGRCGDAGRHNQHGCQRYYLNSLEWSICHRKLLVGRDRQSAARLTAGPSARTLPRSIRAIAQSSDRGQKKNSETKTREGRELEEISVSTAVSIAVTATLQ